MRLRLQQHHGTERNLLDYACVVAAALAGHGRDSERCPVVAAKNSWLSNGLAVSFNLFQQNASSGIFAVATYGTPEDEAPETTEACRGHHKTT